MNEHGQILMPGLAWFLGLLALFFALIGWGRTQLSQQRMDMAASAAALSAARAQALLLNKCALHNRVANAYMLATFKDHGTMEIIEKPFFEMWLENEYLNSQFQNIKAYWNGFRGYAGAVGHHVAKLNGSKVSRSLGKLDIRLQLNDMDVVFLNVEEPVGGANYEHVYYSRLWGSFQPNAQPPHRIAWFASDGRTHSTAVARVLLDVRPDDTSQNGGFPPADGEDGSQSFGIQSNFPQFNAKLVPSSL